MTAIQGIFLLTPKQPEDDGLILILARHHRAVEVHGDHSWLTALVKNISACHWGQGWPYTGESHIHLFPEDGLELWGTRGFHPSNCCHFIPCWSNSAHYCLPLGKVCSLLSLESGVLCVFLTRSSTQDVRREWKGLCHFMSLPDWTFLCILCNLSPQESWSHQDHISNTQCTKSWQRGVSCQQKMRQVTSRGTRPHQVVFTEVGMGSECNVTVPYCITVN